jgi:hypothetical protein
MSLQEHATELRSKPQLVLPVHSGFDEYFFENMVRLDNVELLTHETSRGILR